MSRSKSTTKYTVQAFSRRTVGAIVDEPASLRGPARRSDASAIVVIAIGAPTSSRTYASSVAGNV